MKLYTRSELEALEQKGIIVDRNNIRILLQPADETTEVKAEMKKQWEGIDKILFTKFSDHRH